MNKLKNNKHRTDISNNNIRSARCKKTKKIIALATFVSCFVTAATVNALAAGFQEAASSALVTVVTLIGGGLGAWGVVNLLEGYGNDNPGAKSQGMKQAVAGVGLIIVGATIIPAIFN